MSPGKSFHLSVVTTSRNDNHGKDLIERMQIFLDSFIYQCIESSLSAELIIVEWNPPENKASLAQVLQFPLESAGMWAIRIITVPPEIHNKLKHSNHLPLFQMIAKNVGIRRALGKYVLATNIDILFSNDLISFIKSNLLPNYLYRADRIDTQLKLPMNCSLDEILTYCKKHVFRINTKNGTWIKEKGKWRKSDNIMLLKFKKNLLLAGLNILKIICNLNLKQLIKSVKFFLKFDIKKIANFTKKFYQKLQANIAFMIRFIKCKISGKKPHTNACGDFTLLTYDNWCKLRGYPEWEIFSWHLDSVFLYQAKGNKIKEIDLPRKLNVYHIEHESGFRPEEKTKLFDWLEDKSIGYITQSSFYEIVSDMEKKRSLNSEIIYNDKNWGYGNFSFEEIWINPPSTEVLSCRVTTPHY